MKQDVKDAIDFLVKWPWIVALCVKLNIVLIVVKIVLKIVFNVLVLIASLVTLYLLKIRSVSTVLKGR